MASTIRSIRDKGKLSFGHALLLSVKSMQSRHLSFAFLTSTTLASHSGYSTSLIAPAWRSFPTSSLMAFCLSWVEAPTLLLDWLKGRADVQPMCNYCKINSSHVYLLPREDVFVLSQKLGERAFEL